MKILKADYPFVRPKFKLYQDTAGDGTFLDVIYDGRAIPYEDFHGVVPGSRGHPVKGYYRLYLPWGAGLGFYAREKLNIYLVPVAYENAPLDTVLANLTDGDLLYSSDVSGEHFVSFDALSGKGRYNEYTQWYYPNEGSITVQYGVMQPWPYFRIKDVDSFSIPKHSFFTEIYDYRIGFYAFDIDPDDDCEIKVTGHLTLVGPGGNPIRRASTLVYQDIVEGWNEIAINRQEHGTPYEFIEIQFTGNASISGLMVYPYRSDIDYGDVRQFIIEVESDNDYAVGVFYGDEWQGDEQRRVMYSPPENKYYVVRPATRYDFRNEFDSNDYELTDVDVDGFSVEYGRYLTGFSGRNNENIVGKWLFVERDDGDYIYGLVTSQDKEYRFSAKAHERLESYRILNLPDALSRAYLRFAFGTQPVNKGYDYWPLEGILVDLATRAGYDVRYRAPDIYTDFAANSLDMGDDSVALQPDYGDSVLDFVRPLLERYSLQLDYKNGMLYASLYSAKRVIGNYSVGLPNVSYGCLTLTAANLDVGIGQPLTDGNFGEWTELVEYPYSSFAFLGATMTKGDVEFTSEGQLEFKGLEDMERHKVLVIRGAVEVSGNLTVTITKDGDVTVNTYPVSGDFSLDIDLGICRSVSYTIECDVDWRLSYSVIHEKAPRIYNVTFSNLSDSDTLEDYSTVRVRYIRVPHDSADVNVLYAGNVYNITAGKHVSYPVGVLEIPVSPTPPSNYIQIIVNLGRFYLDGIELVKNAQSVDVIKDASLTNSIEELRNDITVISSAYGKREEVAQREYIYAVYGRAVDVNSVFDKGRRPFVIVSSRIGAKDDAEDLARYLLEKYSDTIESGSVDVLQTFNIGDVISINSKQFVIRGIRRAFVRSGDGVSLVDTLTITSKLNDYGIAPFYFTYPSLWARGNVTDGGALIRILYSHNTPSRLGVVPSLVYASDKPVVWLIGDSDSFARLNYYNDVYTGELDTKRKLPCAYDGSLYGEARCLHPVAGRIIGYKTGDDNRPYVFFAHCQPTNGSRVNGIEFTDTSVLIPRSNFDTLTNSAGFKTGLFVGSDMVFLGTSDDQPPNTPEDGEEIWSAKIVNSYEEDGYVHFVLNDNIPDDVLSAVKALNVVANRQRWYEPHCIKGGRIPIILGLYANDEFNCPHYAGEFMGIPPGTHYKLRLEFVEPISGYNTLVYPHPLVVFWNQDIDRTVQETRETVSDGVNRQWSLLKVGDAFDAREGDVAELLVRDRIVGSGDVNVTSEATYKIPFNPVTSSLEIPNTLIKQLTLTRYFLPTFDPTASGVKRAWNTPAVNVWDWGYEMLFSGFQREVVVATRQLDSLGRLANFNVSNGFISPEGKQVRLFYSPVSFYYNGQLYEPQPVAARELDLIRDELYDGFVFLSGVKYRINERWAASGSELETGVLPTTTAPMRFEDSANANGEVYIELDNSELTSDKIGVLVFDWGFANVRGGSADATLRAYFEGSYTGASWVQLYEWSLTHNVMGRLQCVMMYREADLSSYSYTRYRLRVKTEISGDIISSGFTYNVEILNLLT